MVWICLVERVVEWREEEWVVWMVGVWWWGLLVSYQRVIAYRYLWMACWIGGAAVYMVEVKVKLLGSHSLRNTGRKRTARQRKGERNIY